MFRDKKRYGQDASDIHRSARATFNKPLTWKDPAKVFTCSWSDFFLEEADAWRPDAWEIIRQTPHLTYQILTKRPERIRECLPEDWPMPNVWLGITAENQEMADHRWAHIMDFPVTKFLSVEPMLGPVRLNDDWLILSPDWVICGGESGPGFRPMETIWAETLKRDCEEWKIPFFMKQMAGVNPNKITIPEALNVTEFPGEFQSA
tara:strand:+ start:1291 stop:1905 length:615 start_codon:yes stop_codon:yes gene_type:complete